MDWQCLVLLVALTAVYAIGQWYCWAGGFGPSGTTGLLWRTEFDLVLVWWVYADRRRRGFGGPFEFEAFVFFAWPIVVPYYLVRTRSLRGLLVAAGIYTLAILPLVVGIVARMERGR